MKAIDLVTFATKAYDEKWGYVFGGQGEIYTPELAMKWGAARQGGMAPSYFLNTCKKWVGRRVADCSGLIIAALQSENPKYPDQASGTLFNRCNLKGAISTLPEKPGLCLWRPGHIGIYTGGGYAIEARGVAYGVVRTKVACRNWTHWGMLKDVDYDDSAATGTASASYIAIYRLLAYRKPMLVGDDVQWLQKELNTREHSCGKVDGIFGTKTQSAVKSYQKQNRLVVDGIAGRRTITALGGVFKGSA